jgi:hypothetical protein
LLLLHVSQAAAPNEISDSLDGAVKTGSLGQIDTGANAKVHATEKTGLCAHIPKQGLGHVRRSLLSKGGALESVAEHFGQEVYKKGALRPAEKLA